MPLRNRVNPEGEICFSPSRKATLMGNRGVLHKDGKIVSESDKDAWITCVTEVEPGGEKRPLMEGRHYTVLFFLDEATALAAGHRPCKSCRPMHFKQFKAAWGKANRPGVMILAGDMDAQLKLERSPESRLRTEDLAALPDGAIIRNGTSGAYYLILADKAYQWSFDGYSAPTPLGSLKGPFIILTPASTVGAIRQGYRPALHPSAR